MADSSSNIPHKDGLKTMYNNLTSQNQLGLIRQGSFRTRRTTTTTRKGSPSLYHSASVISRRNTEHAGLGGRIGGWRYSETLFFTGMEVSKSKFNAEFLIHLNYKVAEGFEKEYVLTFRDGSMDDRKTKWNNWYIYLHKAQRKFKNMVDVFQKNRIMYNNTWLK
eukprot:UN22573